MEKVLLHCLHAWKNFLKGARKRSYERQTIFPSFPFEVYLSSLDSSKVRPRSNGRERRERKQKEKSWWKVTETCISCDQKSFRDGFCLVEFQERWKEHEHVFVRVHPLQFSHPSSFNGILYYSNASCERMRIKFWNGENEREKCMRCEQDVKWCFISFSGAHSSDFRSWKSNIPRLNKHTF